MSKQTKYSIKDLRLDFPNDDACLRYLFMSRHSWKCSCGGRYERLKGRKQYQCSKCRFQIAPMKNTIFEKSTTPLTLWFHAIWVFSNAKTGISAKEIERQLGVTYKTAWRILNLIRFKLYQDDKKLSGNVEMDETFFGGRKKAGRNNKNLSRAMKEKSVITGAIQRGGNAKVEVTKNAKAYTLGEFMDNHIDPNNTRLLTDESNRYNRVAKKYKRESVNHKREEYARGDVHVNSLEGFWSHVKRSIDGTHKAISKKYLQSYVDGFVWHYNNRHSDMHRFLSLIGALAK